MELHERADGLVVVNDAYNANPASMAAAIDALVAIGGRRGARTVAVLGVMLELGAVQRRRAPSRSGGTPPSAASTWSSPSATTGSGIAARRGRRTTVARHGRHSGGA